MVYYLNSKLNVSNNSFDVNMDLDEQFYTDYVFAVNSIITKLLDHKYSHASVSVCTFLPKTKISFIKNENAKQFNGPTLRL